MAEELMKQGTTKLAESSTPLGFEDDSMDDLIIPRIKIMQALSPEVQDQKARVGDIVNSLTLERLNDKVFIPVCKFNNHVYWRDRSEGGGIICRAADGKMGQMEDGSTKYCAQCRLCEFDNSKQGREALPKCTKYINFLGFFADDMMPIILSFAKTNMAEGKKMYSMAKVSRQNIWNFGYKLVSKEKTKNNNRWYIIDPVSNGQTSDDVRQIGMELYKQFAGTMSTVNYDMNETSAATTKEIDSEESDF